MTTATTAAPAVWLDLVAGKCWAVEALDYVMEADGCERAVALTRLCGIAASHVKRTAPRGKTLGSLDSAWRSRGLAFLLAAIRRGKLDDAWRLLSGLRDWPDTLVSRPDMYFEWATEPAYSYVAWCDKADAAIAILRELQAIPGGESP